MSRLLHGVVAWLAVFMAASALAEPGRVKGHDVPLVIMNRDIAVLRADLGGVTPAVRVERAKQRFAAVDDAALQNPVRSAPFELDGTQGYRLMFGDYFLFSLVAADLDPESGDSFDTLLQQTQARLDELRRAELEQHHMPTLVTGIWRSVIATLVLLILLWWLTRTSRVLIKRFESARDRSVMPYPYKVQWNEYAYSLLVRVSHLFWLLVGAAFLYVWLTYVLRSFPSTRPLGDRFRYFITSTLRWIYESFIDAIPNLVTVILVLALTRAVVSVLNLFFFNVQAERVHLPFLHAETASATRRIVTIVVWGLGIAMAYPFIPGSSSEAFKGLSVLFGLVISLGSAGLVTQVMSGLVVVYTRALRKNDYVRVSGVEGLIVQIGTLATKVVTVRNEVVTVPNSVLIGSPIHNYSRLGDSRCAMLSVKVCIGYDTPWRQVQAMLIEGAARTEGLSSKPAPYVYQRALGDFSVEYELFTHIGQPMERNTVQSQLLANVLDVFNENGVQIMAPHFQMQPEQSVVARPWSGDIAERTSATEAAPK